MELGIEKYAMRVMKSGKRHLADGMELLNQDKIRTLREKKTYKYLRILKADTIKQQEMEEKIRKNIPGETEIPREKTILQKPCQSDKYLDCSTRKIFWTILDMDQRKY